MHKQTPINLKIDELFVNSQEVHDYITACCEHSKNYETHIFYQNMWFEQLQESKNPKDKKLVKDLEQLHDNPPCLGSDIWYYEEQLGVPSGSTLWIEEVLRSNNIEPEIKHKLHPNVQDYVIDMDWQKELFKEIHEPLKQWLTDTFKEKGLWNATINTEQLLSEYNQVINWFIDEIEWVTVQIICGIYPYKEETQAA